MIASPCPLVQFPHGACRVPFIKDKMPSFPFKNESIQAWNIFKVKVIDHLILNINSYLVSSTAAVDQQ